MYVQIYCLGSDSCPINFLQDSVKTVRYLNIFLPLLDPIYGSMNPTRVFCSGKMPRSTHTNQLHCKILGTSMDGMV